jgi:hypothetical protein
MVELTFEAEIHSDIERVFTLLAELRDYDRWLPRSSAFQGTASISEGPIAVGTTYLEPGLSGRDRALSRTLSPRGPVRLLMPLVMRMFRIENERMIRTLKAYAEADPAREPAG